MTPSVSPALIEVRDLVKTYQLGEHRVQALRGVNLEIASGEFKPRLIGFDGLTEHAAPDLRQPSRDVVPAEDRLNRDAVVGAVTGLIVLMRDGKATTGDLSLIQVAAINVLPITPAVIAPLPSGSGVLGRESSRRYSYRPKSRCLEFRLWSRRSPN